MRAALVPEIRDVAPVDSMPALAVLDSSVEAFVMIDRHGAVVEWNRAATTLFGWSRDEAHGRALTDLIVPESARAAHAAGLARVAGGGEERLIGRRIALDALRRDGTTVEIELSLTTIVVGGERRFAGFISDVSERRAAEAELMRAKQRFEGAFRAATIGMALATPSGRCIAANATLCRLLQRDEVELVGAPFAQLTHADDLPAAAEHLRALLAGEVEHFLLETRYLLPDGGIVWVELAATLVVDADGRPLQVVAQIQDITARRTADGELARYVEQLAAISAVDPVTGLPSGEAFEHTLARARYAEVGATVGVLCAVAGSSTAADVADALRGCAHDQRATAHLGVGCFAVLLSDAPGAEQRVRAALPADVDVARDALGADEAPADLVARIRRRGLHLRATPARPRLDARLQHVLTLAREQLGLPLAFLTRRTHDTVTFEALSGDGEPFGLHVGATGPSEESYCARVLDGRIPSDVGDLTAEPGTRDLEATRQLGLRSYAGVPVLLGSGEVYGALCVAGGEARSPLAPQDIALLSFVAGVAAEAIDDEHAMRQQRSRDVHDTGVAALLSALEARDFYTGEHSKEVVALARAVARRMGLDEETTAAVEHVALLHDIGKVGIPDVVLQKQGPLDPQEWQVMRQHPAIAERIISGISGLEHLAPAMRAEHERWDGAGYPDGLSGTTIPIASRITLACDAFHAMTSDRPYRPRLTTERALAELEGGAGTQFDPTVIANLLAELGSVPR